jgi:hypothetical protein
MTKQRDWPNNARHARDRAAEETNAALIQVDRLHSRIRRGEFTRNGLELDLLEISKRLHVAMRHLEKAGAETEPE